MMETARGASPLSLSDGDVHIWYTFHEEIVDPQLLRRYDQLLTEEDRQRRKRIMFPRGRHEYTVARVLVRWVLCHYLKADPLDWMFVPTVHGKPEIAAPEAGRHLRFNLSHTNGMVVCAVSVAGELGVDVEDRQRRSRTVEIADRFFSPTEAAALRALPVSGRRRRFFDYWTLKEAYIKARGLGLAIPLDQFSFQLSEGAAGDVSAIGITFAEGFDDQAARWQFELFYPSTRHTVAVAWGEAMGTRLRAQLRACTPFASDTR